MTMKREKKVKSEIDVQRIEKRISPVNCHHQSKYCCLILYSLENMDL
jgi:hypothetical protein